MRTLGFDHITLGVCYYPEHWPENIWESDLRRMKESGIEVVRVAEFCWCLFEPSEGAYCFDLFDRFLALCEREKMKVVFCTPTATPPAWLTEQYPDTRNALLDGTPLHHGLRRHYNYNSATYQALTGKIVHALGAHYGDHPSIIGWQLDNEFNCETNEFYSEADHAAFREYMKRKYQTLDNLNEKMGTVVWSQNYSAWEQVHLRRPTNGNQFNPHFLLEERRFISDSTLNYAKLQADILRPYIGQRFITTNGLFGHVDYTRMMEQSLDFLCYDSYPNFALDMNQKKDNLDDIKDRRWSESLMKTRAFSPRFGIMEQQTGANGWTGRMEAPMPRPGQIRLWAMQSLAHGADFISFFRWRTAPCGTEIYWHGILDYDNMDNRRLHEIKAFHADVQKLSSVFDSPVVANVAIARDFANEWDAEYDHYHGRLQAQSENSLFRACQHTHTPADYLYINEHTQLSALAKYRLIIYPHATILEKEIADVLKAYVEQGGTLVFGARTGYKDQFGRCPMRNLAGYAGGLCGVRIKDYTFVGPDDEEGLVLYGEDTVEAPVFHDILEVILPDAKVEAVFQSNYYKGEPAMVSRPLGQGRACYYGAAFSESMAVKLLEKTGCASPVQNILASPSVELVVREKDGESYAFLLNYMRTVQRIEIKIPMTELLTGEVLCGVYDLEPFGVRVLCAKG